jgi:hypothetical protein
MCTVTFIPAKDRIFLTSNRDEKSWRKDAVPPTVYDFESGKILFPKDADAGGTWIAVHENGNAIVFLNGGFVIHQSMPPYRKSRGLILLDLIEGATPYNSFLAIKLTGIEPFTAIVWDDNQLFECRWDGQEKHCRQYDENLPHIWSSVTLYDEDVIQKRQSWFREWLRSKSVIERSDILHFHQFTGDGDKHNDLLMNREGKVFTVSVSSLCLQKNRGSIVYLDLKNDLQYEQEILIEKNLVGR